MAEDLTPLEQGSEQNEAEPEAAPPRRRVVVDSEGPQHFKGRFRLLYLLLALGIAGAIAGAYVIATSKSGSKHAKAQSAWASWTPSRSNEQSVAHQIATRITSEYGSLGDLAQIVSRDPLQLQPPMVAVDIRSDFGIFNLPRKSVLELTDKSWLYELCGADQACHFIPTGGESPAKFQKRVSQEMLELALYTFKYMPTIQSVIVLLPPSGTSATSTSLALYIKRGSIGRLLRQPLREVIGKPGSPLPKINSRVQSHLYQMDPASIQQLPDQSFILALNVPQSGGG